MNRRDILKGMMAGLVVPRLLTADEVKSVAGPQPFPDASPRWQMWVASQDMYVDCPDGISAFRIAPIDLEAEPTIERVYVERPDGVLMLDLAMNTMNGLTWWADLGLSIMGPVRILVDFQAAVSVLPATVFTPTLTGFSA